MFVKMPKEYIKWEFTEQLYGAWGGGAGSKDKYIHPTASILMTLWIIPYAIGLCNAYKKLVFDLRALRI